MDLTPGIPWQACGPHSETDLIRWLFGTFILSKSFTCIVLETLGYKGLLNAKQWFSIFHYTFEYVEQGDSKVSAKGGDNSVKQDTAGSHGGAQPGSVSQGVILTSFFC